jgi:hypothetical protein
VSDRTLLRQVLLRRPIGHRGENAHKEDVAWIDNRFARVGKRLVDEDGIIWTVIETYSVSAPDDLDRRHAAWRRWRDVLEKR